MTFTMHTVPHTYGQNADRENGNVYIYMVTLYISALLTNKCRHSLSPFPLQLWYQGVDHEDLIVETKDT